MSRSDDAVVAARLVRQIKRNRDDWVICSKQGLVFFFVEDTVLCKAHAFTESRVNMRVQQSLAQFLARLIRSLQRDPFVVVSLEHFAEVSVLYCHRKILALDGEQKRVLLLGGARLIRGITRDYPIEQQRRIKLTNNNKNGPTVVRIRNLRTVKIQCNAEYHSIFVHRDRVVVFDRNIGDNDVGCSSSAHVQVMSNRAAINTVIGQSKKEEKDEEEDENDEDLDSDEDEESDDGSDSDSDDDDDDRRSNNDRDTEDDDSEDDDINDREEEDEDEEEEEPRDQREEQRDQETRDTNRHRIDRNTATNQQANRQQQQQQQQQSSAVEDNVGNRNVVIDDELSSLSGVELT